MNNPSLLQNSLLFLAEKVTNACLKLDPSTRTRLHDLAGHCFAFHLRDDMPFYPKGVTVFVLPTEKGIELSADTACVADVSIALYAKDLIPLLKNATIPENISVEGDEVLLLSIIDIIQKLDLDWEEAIAPLTGDVLAHHVGQRVRNTKKWAKDSYQEVKRLTEEYIEEELPIAKQSASFKPFFNGLDKIKSAGDSLRDGWAKK